MLLALRYYGGQMARLRRFTVPAMLLPALGNTCIFYVAPLIVAQLVGRFVSHGTLLDSLGCVSPGFAGPALQPPFRGIGRELDQGPRRSWHPVPWL